MRKTASSEEDEAKALEDAKFKLFRCVSFMNKMFIFYQAPDNSPEKEKYKFTVVDNPNTDELSPAINKYPFPIKYQKTDIEYEFACIEKNGKIFLADQRKTYSMLDKVFEFTEDVQKNLTAIMKECEVLQNNDEFLIEIHSLEDNAEIEEAKYRLLECVSFMDTMRIFYV